MKFRPLHDRIVVRRVTSEEKTKSARSRTIPLLLWPTFEPSLSIGVRNGKVRHSPEEIGGIPQFGLQQSGSGAKHG